MAAIRAGKGAAAGAAVFALVACAGPGPQSEGEYRREQLARSHQRGTEALLRGEPNRAVRQYQIALDQARAMENGDAIAINLLNIAAVLHRAGEFEAARTRLVQLVEHEPPFGAGYLGRAEVRLALIELQLDRPEDAARRAERAAQLCQKPDCPWRAALLNVEAGIALRGGDYTTAEARARDALAAAGRAKDAREEANAWRTLAEAAGAAGRGDEARKAWAAALDIDRRIEAPERIALDLLGLARLELALGDRAAARGYARRAVEVADGARLTTLLRAARNLLHETE